MIIEWLTFRRLSKPNDLLIILFVFSHEVYHE